jgi:Transposase DDE domain
MDFLLEADEPIQREVFFAVANLLNLEVDVLLFDTTSTWFETEEDDGFRRYGHSKDHRPDRPQAVVGLAVTRQGIPVRCWSFAGNASDKVIIRTVHDDLGAWRLHRVLWVGDSGFASAENRTYLQRAGMCWWARSSARAATTTPRWPARAAIRSSPTTSRSKEVWVGGGVGRRRFVVCRNLAEAERDKARRERALARLDEELAAIAAKGGDARLRAEGELLVHPTLARYLSRRKGKLVVDQTKVGADAKLDGKFLLSCTDDTIPAADLAVLYKQLIEVERSWRDLKHVLDLRPIYHRKRGTHPRPRHLVLPGADAGAGRRDHHRRHLAAAAPRTGAHAPGRVHRPCRTRHPAHRDHPTPARATARPPDQRAAAGAGPPGRPAAPPTGSSIGVGTTRQPARLDHACSQAQFHPAVHLQLSNPGLPSRENAAC